MLIFTIYFSGLLKVAKMYPFRVLSFWTGAAERFQNRWGTLYGHASPKAVLGVCVGGGRPLQPKGVRGYLPRNFLGILDAKLCILSHWTCYKYGQILIWLAKFRWGTPPMILELQLCFLEFFYFPIYIYIYICITVQCFKCKSHNALYKFSGVIKM